MTTLGTYYATPSVLHRLPAGVKLAGLLVAAVPILWIGNVWWLAISAAGTLLLLAISRVPARICFAQVKPVLWFAVPLFVLQWLSAGATRATIVVGQLLLLVALAGLVTLTTKVSAMLATIETALRPLRRFGVRPERIALVLALAIRCVPLVARLYDEVRQARRARGLERSPTALAVPLIVRMLKTADGLGEALAARGVDDER